ncbi:hypothetical protein Bca4012_018671 [Brassica carinata]|uniref:Uncharacterized protein n=1 Tax=Brassica carinata TaxID=52824 RepID=A0A8X8BEC6_BRACI|nr:hypothetical protein Bca52824_002975 [Brassica carinata]
MASLKLPLYLIILFTYGVAILSSNVTFECSPSGPCVSCNSSKKRKEKYSCREVGGEEASHKKDAKETQQKDQSNVNDEDDEEVVDASVKQRNRVMTLHRKLRSLSLTKLIEAMFLLRIRREYQFLDLRRFCYDCYF